MRRKNIRSRRRSKRQIRSTRRSKYKSKSKSKSSPWDIVKNALKKGRHKYGSTYNIGNALVDAKN